ncbi:TRAP transporter substrate-binding protein [Neobacillus vireti]|uniref:TRAP transporter substrate-binding protein n=1 Tax=Neobacillus vireti TaxID=220686 RepID=UPI0030009923
MKKKLYVLGLLVLILLLAACGSEESAGKETKKGNDSAGTSDKTYVLRASHSYSGQEIMGKLANSFKEEVEKRSKGRLKIEVYPSAQLLPYDQEIPGLLNGQIDMAFNGSSGLSSIESAYDVLALPFLFDYDPDNFSVAINSLRDYMEQENGGQLLLKKTEERGIKPLGTFVGADPGLIWTRDKEDIVTDKESMKGLKVRIYGGKLVLKTFESLGASGVPIVSTELIPALQQGIIDGTIASIVQTADRDLPVKAGMFLPVVYSINPVIMSKAKFDQLPADLQEILLEAGKTIQEQNDEMLTTHYKEAKSKLEAQGVELYYPTDEEMSEYKKAASPVYDMFKETVKDGQKLIEAAQSN